MKKLTVKQELFCRAFVETGEQTTAYRRCYNCENMLSTTVNTKAYELRVLGHITDRIDELMQEHAERHKLTVDDLIDQLEEARQMAIKTEQSSSMISATMGSAKLLGLDKPAPDGDDEGQELTINFSVSAPVGEIKVTKGKPKDE